MGSYAPRHLKQQPHRIGASIGRRGAAIAVGTALAIPGIAVAEMATASSASAATAVVTVHYGSTGTYVKVVQARLKVSQTSRFDAHTLAAVKRFQGMKHLVVDGWVGPNTWRALGGFPSGRTSAPAPKPSKSTSNVVSIAKRYIGVPYVWGGSTPRGFDCSGFTSYVYRQAGHSLPRTAATQARFVKRISNPRPGDLVFNGFPAYHVGIYVGGGKMIDSAHPGTRVSVHSTWGSVYYGRV